MELLLRDPLPRLIFRWLLDLLKIFATLHKTFLVVVPFIKINKTKYRTVYLP